MIIIKLFLSEKWFKQHLGVNNSTIELNFRKKLVKDHLVKIRMHNRIRTIILPGTIEYQFWATLFITWCWQLVLQQTRLPLQQMRIITPTTLGNYQKRLDTWTKSENWWETCKSVTIGTFSWALPDSKRIFSWSLWTPKLRGNTPTKSCRVSSTPCASGLSSSTCFSFSPRRRQIIQVANSLHKRTRKVL